MNTTKSPSKFATRTAATLVLLAGCFAMAAVTATSSYAQQEDDKKGRKIDEDLIPIRYTFPTAVPGTDYGRARLESFVKSKEMDGPTVVETLFGDFELLGWANLIRSKLGATEFAALDRELEDASLASLVQSAGNAKSDRPLALALDKAKLSGRDFDRGMRKVFEKWRGNETVAYFARQGYSEFWIAGRISSRDKVTETQRAIERLSDRDLESPRRLLDNAMVPSDYEGLLGLWLGLPGRPDKREIEYIFREEEKVLTPEVNRVLTFGDPATAAKVLQRAGISMATFRDHLTEYWKDLERDNETAAKAISASIVEAFERKMHLNHDWLAHNIRAGAVVYAGTMTGGRGLPVLGALEDEGKDAANLADFGISESIVSHFKGAQTFTMVVHADGSVRATEGATRFEGKLDRATGKLDLVAQYGGRDIKLTGVKTHGGGLLLEVSVDGVATERAKRLLRRTRAW